MPRSISELVDDLATHRAIEPKMAAINALVSMGTEVVAPLLGAVQERTAAMIDSDVASLGVRPLASIGLDVIRIPPDPAAKAKDLEDSMELAFGVSRVLTKLDDPSVTVDPAIYALKDPRSNQYMRALAADILGELGDPRAVGALIEVWQRDTNEWVKHGAFAALAKLDKKPRTALEKLLGRRKWCDK